MLAGCRELVAKLCSEDSGCVQDSNFHLVDSRPTRSKGFGQRRHHQQHQHNKRNADKDDYRTLNPGGNKPEQRHQRAPPHQRRPNNFWREQRVRALLPCLQRATQQTERASLTLACLDHVDLTTAASSQ